MNINQEAVKAHISQLLTQIRQLKEKIQNLEIPELGNQASYNKNTDLIEGSKQQLHHIITQYFKDIQNIYIYLSRFYPTTALKQYMKQEIESIFAQLSEYKKKMNDKQFSQFDYEEFQAANYPAKKDEIQQECMQIQTESYPNHTSECMPNIKVQNRITESLYFGLNQYASVYWPSKKGKAESLFINKPNFFIENTICIPYAQDNKLYAYDYASQKIFQTDLNEQIPDHSSFLNLPNGNLFISGGVNSQGQILGECRFIDISKGTVLKLPDMLVKRVGHTLVYIQPNTFWSEAPKGYIYAIGGKTHNNFRTKLCERFNIENQQWEEIEKLNDARSRSSCAYSEEQHGIFVFFGTSSQQLNVVSAERYDLLSKKWERLIINNQLEGFDVSWGNAICINEDQILIFGGLKDSQYFENNLYFSKKILVYNIQNESITVNDSQLPVDLLPLTSIIHDNKVYSVGKYMSCVQLPPHQSLGEGAFLVELGEVNSIICFFG
ncbi:unnamed protein product [Paramecium pentaurelia]|uniref:Attractin/MKLN-like beta-propeller domain-containing protein n=1 Tax=Paramecium pentaurelia TaxID=43138 RepID=A0A8S1WA17_9CILI|nr:unnamed protein product [Paramecium pentaurelia]